ncbi:HYC_CC_PP family protein [Myroides sp. DW712]|uniref:HYC_CC_PP family protein n=1 Tax=Myroides sp. DW712 TaxID=3389800 RepID=UPI003978108E
MKRLVVILLGIMYFFLASGFSTYQHICKGLVQQTSMTWVQNAEESCAFCSKEGKTVKEPQKNCCKDKVEVVKVKAEVQHSSFKVLKVSFFVDAILHRYFGAVYEFITAPKEVITSYLYYLYKTKEIPLYIKHCVYRI